MSDASQPANLTDVDELLRQRESLRELIESISSELELRPLLTGIVRSACVLLGTPVGAIGLYDARRNAILRSAVFGLPESALEGPDLLPGEGLAGQVLLARRPVIVERYGDLPQPLRFATEDHAAIGVPIVRRGRFLGCFSVAAPPPRRFGERDVELLVLFSRHAAVAIENAIRYEREKRRTGRLRLIARVGRIITGGLSLDELLQRAAAAIHEILGYENIALARVDPGDSQTLIMRNVAGSLASLSPSEHRFPIARGIVGAAARERRIQLVNDVSRDPRYVPWPGSEGAPLAVRAELAVPILLSEDLLGVLNVESREPFDEEDATSLQIVADYLAVAIRNARLFASQERRAARLALLVRVVQTIDSGRELGELLQLAADALHETFGYSSVGIPLLDPGEPSVLLLSARGGSYKKAVKGETRQPVERGIMGAAVRERRIQLVNDVAGDLRYVQAVPGYRALAELAVPILWGEDVLGVVNVEGDEPFDEEDVFSLQIVADHLAVAIRNARWFASAQDQAVLRERQRLARDLHDSVVQLLFSVSLIAQSLGGAWRRDAAEGERQLARMLDLTRAALAEMRGLVKQLHPAEPILELPRAESTLLGISRVRQQGLADALRRYADDVAPDGLVVELLSDAYEREPFEREEVLYRIGQEALNNAFRHSGARRVTLRLASRARSVHLLVEDDGRGFDLGRGAPMIEGRLGIRGMRERAEALGGRLAISSAEGSGTTVEIELPAPRGGAL